MLTPNDIFRLHPRIRWAAMSTDNGSVVFSQMRPGVDSHTPNSDDKAFMQLGPLFMTGIAQRLSPNDMAGKLQCVIVYFEKDSVLLMETKDGHLALSVGTAEAFTVFQEILPQLQKLAAKP